ncbi:phosphotransferase [Actinotalea ferrariae]|uniref:phosphotransferase n=1 Tax=Actinotalea ferrariae TaxID=1386098 RepID=UPI001C8B9806|nr:phosphotransferase [Actinotalea ferrariae]MBX9246771.1 phosphotransferase [Actinotalea ferrariae]
MPRSPLALAALATVAVPGLDAFDVRRPAQQSGGVDSAVVIDATGRRWVVRAPQDPAAGAALEAEVALLEALVEQVDAGALPFDVPHPSGFAPLPEGGRAVVHPQLAGRPLRLELLGPGPGLAASVGRAIAALHELPVALVEDAGLPVYDADAYRRRRLAEVDEAARTGRVPSSLLRRWERALEDVAMWRFQPTVVHGDLSAEHVLCRGDAVTGVLGWSEAKVADPADDLAWLLVAAPQEGVDPILEAYTLRRTETSDRHLAARALLAGELALARWLLHGVRSDDAAIVDDAAAMLEELAEHTAEVPDERDAAPVPVGWTVDDAAGVGGESAGASTADGGTEITSDDADTAEATALDETAADEGATDDDARDSGGVGGAGVGGAGVDGAGVDGAGVDGAGVDGATDGAPGATTPADGTDAVGVDADDDDEHAAGDPEDPRAPDARS